MIIINKYRDIYPNRNFPIYISRYLFLFCNTGEFFYYIGTLKSGNSYLIDKGQTRYIKGKHNKSKSLLGLQNYMKLMRNY